MSNHSVTFDHTHNYEDSPHDSVWDFWLPVVGCLLLNLPNLWIVLSLIHHGHRAGKWHKARLANHEKLNQGLIYVFAMACCVIGQFRMVFSTVELFMSSHFANDHLCDVVGKLSFGFYHVAFAVSYMVFWLRQHVFYSHRMLSERYSRHLIFLSRISLLVCFVPGVTSIIIHSSLDAAYKIVAHGCKHEMKANHLHMLAVVLVGFAFTSGQLLFIGLFVYPLRTQLRTSLLTTMRRHGSHSAASTTPPTSRTSEVNRANSIAASCENSQSGSVATLRRQARYNSQKNAKIRHILTRSTVALTVSLVSGITLLSITYHIVDDVGPRRLAVFLNSAFLFAQEMYIVCSFDEYKKVLSSPLRACL